MHSPLPRDNSFSSGAHGAPGGSGRGEEAIARLMRLACGYFDVPLCVVAAGPGLQQGVLAQGVHTEHGAALAAMLAQQCGGQDGVVVEVPDTLADPAWAGHPLVHAPAFRFAAAARPAGQAHARGPLFAIADTRPRTLDDAGRRALGDFAALAAQALAGGADDHAAASTGQLPGDEHNKAILEASLIAFIGVDTSGTVIHWNRAAERMLGWTAGETLGTNLTETIIPADNRYAQAADLAQFLHDAYGKIDRPVQMAALTRDGRRLPVEMTICTYAVGGHKYFGAFLQDVTALKQFEIERRLNESRLRTITENLPSMIGHVDSDEKVLFLNDHGLRFYGVTREQIIGKPVRQLYAQADYLALKPFMDKARAGRRSSFENQVMVDGAPRHYSVVYVPDNQGQGGACGFFVMATDITARKLSELAHVDSERRLRLITDNMPVLISYIDSQEIFRFANATHERWYGMQADALIGKPVRSVFGAAMYAQVAPYLRQVLAGQPVHCDMPARLTGGSREAEVEGIPDIHEGVVAGAYLMTTDVTAARLHEAQLQLLARSDPLTGLANRRSYEERLREAVLRSARSGRPMALLFLDIDFFKQINDTLGHAGGDEVLKEFASRLSCAVRATDTVCRLAGDEFTVILEGLADVADARAVGDKILALVRAPFVAAGRERSVTTSIGIAIFPGERADAEALPAQADAALYAAKAAGRNQYAVHGEGAASA